MFEQCFDEEIIKKYIAKEPEITLFYYGDLENYGTHKKVCQFFINRVNGKIDSLILIYRNTLFNFYSQEVDFNLNDVVEFIKDKKVTVFSGKENLVKRILPYLSYFELESTYMARCNKVISEFKFSFDKTISYREITADNDILEMVRLINSIDEFEVTRDKSISKAQEVSNIKDSIKAGGLNVGVYKNNKLVAVASTTASSKISAMIVGVATQKEERGNGFASFAVSKLCELSFKSGKEFLCLFYDNPKAGSIYHKIGFVDVDKYAMIHRK